MKNKNFIIVVIVLALIASGALLFINLKQVEDAEQPASENSEQTVAEVGGKKITANDVAKMQELAAAQGSQLSKEDVLEELINQEIIYQQAEKQGFARTKEESEEILESYLLQQNSSLEEFKQQLAEQGFSYEKELENLEKQTTIENYLDSVLAEQDFEVSEEEAMDFYQTYSQMSAEEFSPYEELEAEIMQVIKQQKQQEAIIALLEELRKEAGVVYY